MKRIKEKKSCQTAVGLFKNTEEFSNLYFDEKKENNIFF